MRSFPCSVLANFRLQFVSIHQRSPVHFPGASQINGQVIELSKETREFIFRNRSQVLSLHKVKIMEAFAKDNP